jgi:hypothetical protein
MPRYPGQNLASLNPAFRKEHKIDDGSQKLSRYTFGKNVVVAAGDKMLSSGFCMRLMPTVDSASGQPQLSNFREGRDLTAFGDWCRFMTVAYWVGNPGVCFIVHDNNPELDIKQSPYFLLRDAARTNKETPGIGRLFTELTQPRVMNSHIGSLSAPEKMLFISASAVYVDDRGQITLGAFSDDPKRNARVIGLKYSATQGLLSALNARDPNTGEFLSGDMLAPGAAKLLTILPESYQAGPQQSIGLGEHGPDVFQCPPYARSQDPNAQYIIGRPAQKSRSAFTHYAIIHDTFRGQQISLEPYMDRIVSEGQTFDDMLYVPSYEEQAELLSRAFPHEVLEFAWQDFPEYRRNLRGRTTTVEAPQTQFAAAPQYGGPPQAQVQQPWNPAVSTPPGPAGHPGAVGPTGLHAGQHPPGLSDFAGYPAAEISEDEAAGVVDIFATPAAPQPVTAAIPPGASVPPPPPRAPSAGKPARVSPAEIMGRVRKSAQNG